MKLIYEAKINLIIVLKFIFSELNSPIIKQKNNGINQKLTKYNNPAQKIDTTNIL